MVLEWCSLDSFIMARMCGDVNDGTEDAPSSDSDQPARLCPTPDDGLRQLAEDMCADSSGDEGRRGTDDVDASGLQISVQTWEAKCTALYSDLAKAIGAENKELRRLGRFVKT